MHAPAATDGDLVYLRGASFRDYERLVEIRGERGSPRLAYLDGTIELVSPSPEHEEMRSLLGRLLEAWCLARGVRFTALGQWTLKRGPKAVGRSEMLPDIDLPRLVSFLSRPTTYDAIRDYTEALGQES